MSSDTQDLNVKMGRTRRNMLKTGAITASALVATLASAKSALAGPGGPGGPGPGGGQVQVQVQVRVRVRWGPGGPGPGGRCFLRGTTILTADGDRRIEDLAIGDLLPTVFGGVRPIQWIGRYPFRKSDPSKSWPKDVRPIRVARSALAPNVPQADLYVTQAHGVFIDDVLVSAEYLINETTITLYEASELNELEFFHIKLESHDVIYAEGAPVETLLNVDESAVNFARLFSDIWSTDGQRSALPPNAQQLEAKRFEVALPQRDVVD